MTIETDETTPMEGVTAKRGKSISREELQEMVRLVQDHPLRLGEKWYIVSTKWWTKLYKAAKDGYPDDVPAIDCANISSRGDNGYYLNPRLVEGIDFTFLPSVVFNRLREVYGIESEERDFIEREVYSKNNILVLETYRRIVTVSLVRDSDTKCMIQVYGDDTMSAIRQRVLELLNLTDIPPERLRFFINNNGRYELIDATQQSIDSYFDTAQNVVVDVQDEDGSWFLQRERLCPYYVRSDGILNSSGAPIAVTYRHYTPGVCGLQNLGNTCFMASAIQCLSNIPPLTEYFLSQTFLGDINETNPLGTKGELARAYGDLIQNMWSGENSFVYPRKLKGAIGSIAPRFCGYNQQDAQELLAFLLDGLHEDLNRIKKKPYIEEEEYTDLEEHKAAELAWQNYKARNDSEIVDRFHGQLKSTLVCPVCEKVSIKFDPFCFLSVPLPPKDRSRVIVTVMLYGSTSKRWAKFSITSPRSTTTAQDIIDMILRDLKINVNLVLFTVGEQSDDVVVLRPETLMSEVARTSLFAAQVDHSPSDCHYVIVKNQGVVGRVLSLPMIFSLPKSQPFTREFFTSNVLTFTRQAFQSQGLVNGMNINDRSETKNLCDDNEKEMFSIYVESKDAGNEERLVDNHPLPYREDGSPLTVVFRWTDIKFNSYKGDELIEREIVQKLHLVDCIDLFTKTEQLGIDDSWYCPQCKKHERATKKLELWNLPEILIIHLKRFQYSRFHRDKIDTQVTIPVKNFELNSKLANERHEHVLYDLIAISHHMGGLGGGHYTATALNSKTKKWYDFNDSSTQEISEPSNPYIASSPYLLVYQRREAEVQTDANVEMEAD